MILKWINKRKNTEANTEEIKNDARKFIAENMDSAGELFRRLDEYTSSRTGSDDPLKEIAIMAKRVREKLTNEKKSA